MKDYVHHKQVKLMSKGNRDMIEPLTEIYEMLNLQDLHFKMLEHGIDTGRKARKERGGKKASKKFRRAKSVPHVRIDPVHTSRLDL